MHKEWQCVCGENWTADVPQGVLKILDSEWIRIHDGDFHYQATDPSLEHIENVKEDLSRWLDDGGQIAS